MKVISQTIVLEPGEHIEIKSATSDKSLTVFVEGGFKLIYNNGQNEEFGYECKKQIKEYELQ